MLVIDFPVCNESKIEIFVPLGHLSSSFFYVAEIRVIIEGCHFAKED